MTIQAQRLGKGRRIVFGFTLTDIWTTFERWIQLLARDSSKTHCSWAVAGADRQRDGQTPDSFNVPILWPVHSTRCYNQVSYIDYAINFVCYRLIFSEQTKRIRHSCLYVNIKGTDSGLCNLCAYQRH